MSYFDPKIYCKQNLKEKDLIEIEHWKDECEVALDMAYDRYEEEHCSGDSMMLDEIKTQIVTEFVEIAKECLGERLQENLVDCIDHYEEELSPVEDPKTFDCCSEEDEVEEIPFSDIEDSY